MTTARFCDPPAPTTRPTESLATYSWSHLASCPWKDMWRCSPGRISLALMLSPHPGHLSLEPPAAGIPTLTNRFGSYREAWLPTLYLADPDPHALAQALAEAAWGARGLEMHDAQQLPATLGVSLDDAIRTVASRL